MREGSGISQLAQMIRKHGYNDFDRFELATITSITPTRVQVDGMKIELDAFDIVIAEHLTEHIRTVSINGGDDTEMIVRTPLNVGDRVIVASMSGGQTYVVIDKAVTL